MIEVNTLDNIGPGIVIVDFWAEWCGPCKMLLPILEKLDKERDDITILKFDIQENQDIPIKMGIKSVPTLIIYKDGKEIDRILGLQNENALLSKINEISNG